jgi:tetratricopeptide (TPR) repeat protein
MFEYDENADELNVSDLVHQYESLLSEGKSIYFESDNFQDLIDYYEEQFDYNKALQVVNYALVHYSFSAVFHIRKAQLLLEEDSIDEANDALKIAKLYEPNNIDVYLTEVEILHQSEKYEESLDLLERAVEFSDKEDLEDIYLLQASVFESMDDYHSAFNSLVKVVKINPFNELAFSRLWMCMELTEAYERGVSVNLEIIDESPYSYWAWYNLGHAYTHLGNDDKAFEAYDYAIVINESFEFAYRDAIACLFRLEKFEFAKQYIEDYKKQFDLDTEVLVWEGECYEYSGNYEKARGYYADALKLDSLDGRVLYRIGVTYANQENWILAQNAFEQACRINNNSEEFCIALAEVYHQSNQVKLAEVFFKKAIELAPEEDVAWLSYLEFLIRQKDFDTAIDLLPEAKKFCGDILLDLFEVVILILSGKRQLGLINLMLLMEDKIEIDRIFEIAPELKTDPEVNALISSFKN